MRQFYTARFSQKLKPLLLKDNDYFLHHLRAVASGQPSAGLFGPEI